MLFKSFFFNAVSFLFCFILVSFPAPAQSASYLDSLDGKYALQFQISDNFNLSSFQGSTLSGKYNFSCRDAIRLGVSHSFSDTDNDMTTNMVDTVHTTTYKGTQNTFGITASTQYIRYLSTTDDISFYGGTGPYFRYSKSTIDSKSSGIDGVPPDRKETQNAYTIGIDLLIGVEWMFTKNMTLSAEYVSKFFYNSSERKSEVDIVTSKTTSKYYSFEGKYINFGLSVYF